MIVMLQQKIIRRRKKKGSWTISDVTKQGQE